MNLIFLGTPSFALPSLKGLALSNHQISAVVTQPDRPRGRSGHPLPPPVKELALESGLRVLQPDSVNEEPFLAELRGLAPDIIVVVAFGQRLSRAFIELPKICCINLHASLLPKYRGAAPINWAIIRGETHIGANLLTKVVDGFELSNVCFLPQRHDLATMAPKLKKEDGLIKWAQPAQKVHNSIRGMNPRPGAYTSLPTGRRLLILRSRLATEDVGVENIQPLPAKPGTIIKLSGEGLIVAANGGALWITHLQPEGGKAMTAAEYLRGHPLHEGEAFN